MAQDKQKTGNKGHIPVSSSKKDASNMATYPQQPPSYGAYDPPPQPGFGYPPQQPYYPPPQPGYPPQQPGYPGATVSQPTGGYYPGQPPTQTIGKESKQGKGGAMNTCFQSCLGAMTAILCCNCLESLCADDVCDVNDFTDDAFSDNAMMDDVDI